MTGANLVSFLVGDSTLYQSATGSLSNGAGDHLFAGNDNASLRRRAVLAFDLGAESGRAMLGKVMSAREAYIGQQAEFIKLATAGDKEAARTLQLLLKAQFAQIDGRKARSQR